MLTIAKKPGFSLIQQYESSVDFEYFIKDEETGETIAGFRHLDLALAMFNKDLNEEWGMDYVVLGSSREQVQRKIYNKEQGVNK